MASLHLAAFNNISQSLLSGNNSARTSLINNSNLSASSSNLVPVAFLPISSFYPSMQKLYDEMSQKEATLNEQSFSLPQVELSKPTVEFGTIPEYSLDVSRVLFKLNTGNRLSLNSTLCIEVDDSKDWNIISLYQNDCKKQVFQLDSLKYKLDRTLSLGLTKLKPESKSIKLDSSSFYEFFVHLNTKDVNYFKEIIKETNDSESLHPLNVQAFLSIYYCHPQGKRYLLNRVEVNYILGYAHLKTSANLDQIVFDLNDEIKEDNVLREINKSLVNSNEKRRFGNAEKEIPLSNAGNIDVEIECYLVLGEHRLQGHDLRIENETLNLEARNKSKKMVKLILNKCQNEEIVQLKRAKLVIQVKPNGFKYEIPIRFKQIKNLKLSTSCDILFFGKAIGLQDELSIINSNKFKIKVTFLS